MALPLFVLGAESLAGRLSGRFLLQVEDGGRVWYVSPTDKTRYEVTFGNALPLFKKLALGISNADIAKIPESPTLGSELLDSKYCVKETVYIHDNGMVQTVKEDSTNSWIAPPVNTGAESNTTPTSGDTTGTTQENTGANTGPTEPQAAPTLTFESDKASILVGGSAILKWDSSGADSCVLKVGGDEPISVETSGVRNETIKDRSNYFTITCVNAKGSVYKQVKITGTSIVMLSANALPTSLLYNGIMRELGKVTPILNAEIAEKTTTKLYYRINKSIGFAVQNIKLYKYSSSGNILISQSDLPCSDEECLYEFVVNEPLSSTNPVQYILKGDIIGSLSPGSLVSTTLYNLDYTGKLYDQEITEPVVQTMVK